MSERIKIDVSADDKRLTAAERNYLRYLAKLLEKETRTDDPARVHKI